MRTNRYRILAALLIGAIVTGSVSALDTPTETQGVGQLVFRNPGLDIEDSVEAVDRLPPQASERARQRLTELGLSSGQGRLDARGGRWATLLFTHPLLPGKGVGNKLKWPDGPSPHAAAHKKAAWDRFADFMGARRPQLQIDVGELAAPGKVTVHQDGDLVQIHGPRRVDGVPVRGSYVSAVVNRGNLVLFGAHRWGDIDVATRPDLSAEDAAAQLGAFLDGFAVSDYWGRSALNIVPVSKGRRGQSPVGRGYGHRLVWSVKPLVSGDARRWEALVDAHSGEVLSFEDTAHYAEVKGGVLPVTNDGIVPDGVEQPGWPMPFQDTTLGTTDTGGNVAGSGSITATFFGPYVNINDQCGAEFLTQNDNIDWGTSAGTDCVTPGFGGAGNTHASRTGFYELNKVIEMARGQLPSNSWLQQRLTANMNINNTCNAFWNGTVNFYRSGGGCSNTGEIAGVFDHEWGHGLDANDATPGIASPSGEGIADIYTALRLNDSCIGRNFRATMCSGNGDPCLTCTGVRDIDFLKRQSGIPHNYSWSNANCGGSVHCVGAVYAEAVWSLWKRKLQSAPYNYDSNTAHEIVTRLTYLGAGNTGTWFSGGPPNGGCAGSSGYMNYLAADDDDGDLNNGTPHMTAIYEAFNAQEIACQTPIVQDSGCAGTPTAAPSVTGTASEKSASLSWGAVAAATGYEVFRTEGVFACDFGKVRLGETTGTVWNDTELQNGRDYSYVVIPKGPADSCFGPASSCTTVQPVPGPNLDVDAASAVLDVNPGDGDSFIDNCEGATVTFDVDNTGAGSLTNVRITGVTAVSHPATTVSTSFPAAVSPSTLAEGATGTGSFSFTAGGLAFGDTLVFEISVTSDELFPTVKTQTVSLVDAESDLQLSASKTWDFETDLDGWTVIQGTFNQSTSGGGAGGNTGYVASSAFLDNQCDQVRSPAFRLTATSTMTLQNNYDIEDFSSGQWWDRANVAFFESGARNAVDPDGGRLYNATGLEAGATCATAGQDGWANVNSTWGSSSWSADALGAAGRAGQTVQLDVAYGTDPAVNGKGFWFDQVTVTNVEELVPDGQFDICSGNALPVAADDSNSTTEDVAVGGNVLTNDDQGDAPATVTSFDATSASGGTVNVNPDGSYTYTPATGFAGTDTFTYTITDSNGDISTATVTITVTDEGDPDAFDDSATTAEDTPVTGDWDDNDSLIDGAVLALQPGDATPSNGTVTVNADGSYNYTPNTGFAGTDSFTYTICDDDTPTPSCSTATVTIAVDPDQTTNIHVGDLIGNVTDAKRGRWNATVTITVHGDGEIPLTGATVDWSWSNGTTGSGSCTTNTNGQCSIVKRNLKSNVNSVTFSVTGVILAGYTYQPTENHDYGGGATRVIVYRDAPPQDSPPVVSFTADCNALDCVFDGTASFDPDGGQLTAYDWSFGDGNEATGATPSHSYSAAGMYSVTLIVIDDEDDSNDVTQDVTVDDSPSIGVHIGDLDASSEPAPRLNRWVATVTITVHDASHNPVSDATAEGSWSNGANGSSSCTVPTDDFGQCSLTKGNIKGNASSATFTVTSVTGIGITYTGPNHDEVDTDSSDGTSITITQP